MALTGHLSDLSLSELIEFFCNQRKTGRLKVHYPKGPGYFHLQTGSVVDAQVGTLRGIDAVYYALTLPNASFEFNGSVEATERTINQPWTQVVLEGLRRLDEGIVPTEAFPEGFVAEGATREAQSSVSKPDSAESPHVSHLPAFLSLANRDSIGQRKPLIAGAAAVAVVLSVAAIGVPAGWYGRSKSPAVAKQSNTVATPAAPVVNDPAANVNHGPADADPHASEAAALAAKRQREKEKKAREDRANAVAGNQPPASSTPPNVAGDSANKAGAKKVTVQVTYDDSGRVVQASGSDATAIRIARQKRFPPGKAGTATVTIPIN
jgi:hypothetical protein